MKDIRGDLNELFLNLSRLPPTDGARTIMFVGSNVGAGTTSVSMSFGLLAAGRSTKAAWLVDLDLQQNTIYQAFRKGFARDVGKPGRAYDASLKQKPIYKIAGSTAEYLGGRKQTMRSGMDTKLLTAHQIEGTRLMVTRFRKERLEAGQSVTLQSQPGWWQTVRQVADWVIIDAPPVQTSGVALRCAAQMDGVVLVIKADETSARDAINLQTEIEANGGVVLGSVMNAARLDTRLARHLSY
ncbi:MAG: hypothetical protein AAFX02_02650 [Pseudomonadota bacterium]